MGGKEWTTFLLFPEITLINYGEINVKGYILMIKW